MLSERLVTGIALSAALLLPGCIGQPFEFSLDTIFLRPTAEIVGTPADQGHVYEEVRVPIAEGREVSIWHVRSPESRALIVIIPGSDRNKSRYLIALPVFVPAGYDVILMDYEGFGESTGGPLDLARLTENGLAVVDYALTQHEKVVAFGISTGAATAVQAARARDLHGLLLEAPLVLLLEPRLWLQDAGLDVPWAWEIAEAWIEPQMPDSFDILRDIPDVTERKLIMQSVEDDVVPFPAGEMVFEAAAEPKEFYEMRGGHGKMIEIAFEEYQARIIDWLDSLDQPLAPGAAASAASGSPASR